MAYRIAVGTGGTFTGVVVADAAGQLTLGKALTTPERSFGGLSEALRVGPLSAGSEPGPACYGRGGGARMEGPAIIEEPTTTAVIYPRMHVEDTARHNYLLFP